MNAKLVVGNWKMFGSRIAGSEFAEGLRNESSWTCDAAICVPFPYLGDMVPLLARHNVTLGAQDCSAHESGAFTGEVAASMLADVGCTYVIVGHSERRTLHAEQDHEVALKAKAVLAHRMTPIVCVGETLAEREADRTDEVVQRQLAAVIEVLGDSMRDAVVAYEPVWAIGTGKTASPEQAQAVHALLRAQLAATVPAAVSIRLLYGGSVKPDNAASLFAQRDIDGGLVGGASLKSADFVAICRAATPANAS